MAFFYLAATIPIAGHLVVEEVSQSLSYRITGRGAQTLVLGMMVGLPLLFVIAGKAFRIRLVPTIGSLFLLCCSARRQLV